MSATVLIADDEENARINISQYLSGHGYEVVGAAKLSEAREDISKGIGDVVVLDVQFPDGLGLSLLEETQYMQNRPPMILMTAYGDIEMAVEAMKNGAIDFLQKPIELARLERSIQRGVELVDMRRELAYHRSAQMKEMDFVIGKSKAMQTVVQQARRVAQASVPVLITGETGTGKEVLAKFMHKIGPRSGKRIIPINCAAIQSTILESELFGYEPGAFTGADKRKAGLIEAANEGVLFLDEISSMPWEMQSKMLRVLEDHKYMRVGGTTELYVDVQVIAATNKDLKVMISEGKFREDLYFRLNIVDLHLPALKDRKEDIPDLVGLFIRHNNAERGLNITDITPRAMQVLMDYSWPGNIRELKNAIDRAMIFCDDCAIDLPHLPTDVVQGC